MLTQKNNANGHFKTSTILDRLRKICYNYFKAGEDMMIRIAIVDDEPDAARYVAKKMIERAKVLGISISTKLFYSGKELLDEYTPKLFDVVFLDIQMPEMNGDELSAKLIKIDPMLLLVYVTNLCNGEVYTMLKYMPIGFLRKPLFEDEIDSMLIVLKDKIASSQKIYTIKNGKKILQISLRDVIYVESELNYVFFHMNDSSKDEQIIKIRQKLDEVENDIEQYGFIRSHSSYLVNYNYIFSINLNNIRLSNNEILPISKSYKAHVTQKFLYFSREM